MLEELQVLKTEGEVTDVSSLTVCGDVVISGHCYGSLRVWNKATGHCDQVLRGHTMEVEAMLGAVPREWVRQ